MDVAPKVQNARLGILLLCVSLHSGSARPAAKIAADYHILQVVWARYVFHALVFLIIFSRSGILNQMRTSRPLLHIARSITLLLGTITFFTALIYLSLPDAVAINFAAPLLVTALSVLFLGEAVGPRRWVAIFIGFRVSNYYQAGFGHCALGGSFTTGDCRLHALYQILTRVAGRTEDKNQPVLDVDRRSNYVSCIVPLVWKVQMQAWAIMIATAIRLWPLSANPCIRGSYCVYLVAISLHTDRLGYDPQYNHFNQVPDEFSILGTAIVISSGLISGIAKLKNVLLHNHGQVIEGCRARSFKIRC